MGDIALVPPATPTLISSGPYMDKSNRSYQSMQVVFLKSPKYKSEKVFVSPISSPPILCLHRAHGIYQEQN